MCFSMNSSQADNVHGKENITNLSVVEQLTTRMITNDIPYLDEEFESSFMTNHEQQDQNCNNLQIDNSILNSMTSCSSVAIEDELGFQDDNLSHVGSDYTEFQYTDLDNLFVQPNMPEPYERQFNDPEMKYDPSELMLIPPSGSAMHFNYNIPAKNSQPDSNHNRSNIHPSYTMPNNNAHLELLLDSQSEEISCSIAATPSISSNCSTNIHSNQGSSHRNMWYPNAPFSTYKCNKSNTHTPHYGSQVSRDQSSAMFHISNSGREARNRAEKHRRDKLNGSIQELSTMVPHVAESPRRVDKTAVLRFAAHGLRLSHVFGKSLSNNSSHTTDALMKLLDSFFLTLSCNGQIVLVSTSIEQHLGHCQTDLYGQNILHITHPEDHQMLKEKLIPTDLNNLFDVHPEDQPDKSRLRTQEEEDEIDQRLREDKRSFTIRLARSGPRSEPTVYELVKLDGSFRRSDNATRGLKTSTHPTTLQLMRRSRGREEITPLQAISGNDIVLIAIARIVRPPIINRAVEVNRLEYKTRHLIDGRIIDCDQRISIVAGYMTDEVRNLSPFTFIHQDDVRWVIVALRQMYDCNSSYGESTYRLFTRNGKIIYLHTKGFLEIDKNTNKVHSFICVNTLLDEEEGKRRVENMKKKFSVIINTKITQSSDDVPASENPQQLEKAVLCLIKNLKSSSDDDDSEVFPSTSFSAKSHHHHHCGGTSPSLALVPPAADSIKNSITKSVNVVNTTAAKFLHSTANSCAEQQSVLDSNCGLDFQISGVPDDFDYIFYSQNTDSDENISTPEQDESTHYTSSGAVKRKLSCTISEIDNDEYMVPTQRQAVEDVLSCSLQQINNRLNRQLNTAMELRDQSQLYDVPHTEERIADIMKEHQKQQEMYRDITNEFEVQRKNGQNSSSNTLLHEYAKDNLEAAQHDQEEKHQQQ